MPRFVPLAAIPGLALGAVVLAASPVAPAAALTMQECSAKYQSAKRAGTLGGLTWPAFRRAECGVAPYKGE